jgi:hypothetical protein
MDLGDKTKISVQLSILVAALVVAYRLGFVHANMERTDLQMKQDYNRLHELIIQEVGGLRSDWERDSKSVHQDIDELQEYHKE